MKNVKFLPFLIILFLLIDLAHVLTGCNNPPAPPPPPPPPVAFSVQVLASSDTVFNASPITVYSPVSSSVQTAGFLYSDNQFVNKVTFTYLKFGNTIYYSPLVNGQFFPYISGSSPPPIKK